MSINASGLTGYLADTQINIVVRADHPLLRLSNILPWQTLADLALADLKATTAKQQWWLGCPLRLRIHLGTYLLQQLYNYTDRQVEYAIKDNAAYQLFCGRTLVKHWHCPDHTKIEEFRSRLNPETQRTMANQLAMVAAKLGFANPRHVNIDFTIQEANCQYPATVNLMIKTVIYAKRLRNVLVDKVSALKNQLPKVGLKAVKSIARNYFFVSRKQLKDRIAKQTQTIKRLWQNVAESALPVLQHLHLLQAPDVIIQFPVHLQRLIHNFGQKAPGLIDSWFMELFEGIKQKSQIYAYHLNAISCFNKNKLNKKIEVGRNFQLMCLVGNFAAVLPCASIRMPDAASVPAYLTLHQQLFGKRALTSLAADKGYYAKDNEALLIKHQVEQVGLQRPNRKLDKPPDNPTTAERQAELANRRSGIEAMISHIKHGGQLGRSRMKSDSATEAAGYNAVLGFNCRQMIRYLTGEAVKIAV